MGKLHGLFSKIVFIHYTKHWKLFSVTPKLDFFFIFFKKWNIWGESLNLENMINLDMYNLNPFGKLKLLPLKKSCLFRANIYFIH
jgi:hypothetical protein